MPSPAVPYDILYCSSQDQKHPINQLAGYSTHSIDYEDRTVGWQSMRYSKPPQIIVLRFNGNARLRHIRITAHESKIPSGVEIRTYKLTEGELSSPPSFRTVHFTHIGNISFSSSTECIEQGVRQTQSYFVKVDAYFVKISLGYPFVNNRNLAGQVGLYSIHCRGSIIISVNTHLDQALVAKTTPFLLLHPDAVDDNGGSDAAPTHSSGREGKTSGTQHRRTDRTRSTSPVHASSNHRKSNIHAGAGAVASPRQHCSRSSRRSSCASSAADTPTPINNPRSARRTVKRNTGKDHSVSRSSTPTDAAGQRATAETSHHSNVARSVPSLSTSAMNASIASAASSSSVPRHAIESNSSRPPKGEPDKAYRSRHTGEMMSSNERVGNMSEHDTQQGRTASATHDSIQDQISDVPQSVRNDDRNSSNISSDSNKNNSSDRHRRHHDSAAGEELAQCVANSSFASPSLPTSLPQRAQSKGDSLSPSSSPSTTFRSVPILEFEAYYLTQTEQLLLSKEQAVAVEDFETATACRHTLHRLNHYAKEMYVLEQNKVRAIIEENFALAGEIKLIMDTLVLTAYDKTRLPVRIHGVRTTTAKPTNDLRSNDRDANNNKGAQRQARHQWRQQSQDDCCGDGVDMAQGSNLVRSHTSLSAVHFPVSGVLSLPTPPMAPALPLPTNPLSSAVQKERPGLSRTSSLRQNGHSATESTREIVTPSHLRPTDRGVTHEDGDDNTVPHAHSSSGADDKNRSRGSYSPHAESSNNSGRSSNNNSRHGSSNSSNTHPHRSRTAAHGDSSAVVHDSSLPRDIVTSWHTTHDAEGETPASAAAFAATRHDSKIDSNASCSSNASSTNSRSYSSHTGPGHSHSRPTAHVLHRLDKADAKDMHTDKTAASPTRKHTLVPPSIDEIPALGAHRLRRGTQPNSIDDSHAEKSQHASAAAVEEEEGRSTVVFGVPRSRRSSRGSTSRSGSNNANINDEDSSGGSSKNIILAVPDRSDIDIASLSQQEQRLAYAILHASGAAVETTERAVTGTSESSEPSGAPLLQPTPRSIPNLDPSLNMTIVVSSIGNFLTACLTSRQFKLREVSLLVLSDEMGKPHTDDNKQINNDYNSNFNAITNGKIEDGAQLFNGKMVQAMEAVLRFLDMNNFGLQDSIPNVVFAACTFVRMALAEGAVRAGYTSTLVVPLMNLVPRLLCRAADALPRMRDEALITLKLFVQSSAIPASSLVSAALADPIDLERRTRPTSHARVQIARLALLQLLLDQNRFAQENNAGSSAIMNKLLLPSINHQAHSVRDTGTNLLIALATAHRVIVQERDVQRINNANVRDLVRAKRGTTAAMVRKRQSVNR